MGSCQQTERLPTLPIQQRNRLTAKLVGQLSWANQLGQHPGNEHSKQLKSSPHLVCCNVVQVFVQNDDLHRGPCFKNWACTRMMPHPGVLIRIRRPRLRSESKVAVMQFPDPHFKNRHKKRRIVQPQFIAELASLMAPKGAFFSEPAIAKQTMQTCVLCMGCSTLHL